MIAIGFPTKYEAQDFLKHFGIVKLDTVNGVLCCAVKEGGTDLVIAVLGMGSQNAAKSVRSLLEHFSVELFVLAGFAGALTDALSRGQILLAQGCTSEETMADVKLLSGFDVARLVTVDKIVATAEEKRKLASASGCQFVDMETTGVLTVVKPYGVELIVVRAISDLAGEDLPADILSRSYDFSKAQETPLRLALYLATHPHRILALKNFLRPLPEVRQKLSYFLLELVRDFS